MLDFLSFKQHRYTANGVEISSRIGGEGQAIVLLHGYPQNNLMWRKIAPKLAEQYLVLAPDLRGYGESEKPDASNEDHTIYCKRTTALDVVKLAEVLSIDKFHVVGHDRGARVGHRMALDYPDKIFTFTSLDVMPSQAAFDAMDSSLAYAWFHWHLMRQPYPLPEKLIGNSSEDYFDFLMERWCATEGAIEQDIYDIYKRHFCTPDTVHATCAEYRSVELDLQHDEADRGRKLKCPVQVLWGSDTRKRPGWQTGKGLNMLEAWRARADFVEGHPIDCGHFIAEEQPETLLEYLLQFFQKI